LGTHSIRIIILFYVVHDCPDGMIPAIARHESFSQITCGFSCVANSWTTTPLLELVVLQEIHNKLKAWNWVLWERRRSSHMVRRN